MSGIKPLAKKFIKRNLRAASKVLKKNKYTHKAIILTRNAMFPNIMRRQNVYDHLRYYPTIEEYHYQCNDGLKAFAKQPLISIVMPTYNTPIKFLERCIESVLVQSYPNWELCVADDRSTDPAVVEVLERFAKRDSRVKYVVRKENGHISLATNSAIELAGGEFIALLDHDDVLWPNALYEVVNVINKHPKAAFIYSDEDKINSKGDIHSYPFFKPAWSPEFLESCNYITHFSVLKADIVRQVGGLRKGYEGAQDWDLFLRVAGVTGRAYNIPKVLYSWRIHEASTAHNTDAKPYVYEAQRKLLEDHVLTSGLQGKVSQGIIKQHSSITYDVVGEPMVSVVVYARNVEEAKRGIQSLVNQATYTKSEFIVVTDGASQPAAVRFAERMTKHSDHVRHLHHAGAFKTDSARYNYGLKAAKGEYVAWMRPYLQVTTVSWMELMLGDAQRQGVGVVAAKLVNPARTEYVSAGIGIGIDGFCGDLLNGVALTDVHYMRGLYGQSRRNTTAARGLMLVKRDLLKEAGWLSEEFSDDRLEDIDACLQVLGLGYRNVYTPYVEAIDPTQRTGNIDYRMEPEQKKAFKAKWRRYVRDDPYLNRNFSRVGAHLNVN